MRRFCVGLASVPGGSISTRLPNSEAGPTAEARRIMLAFAQQVAEVDKRSGLERKTAERISRNFPRES
ncbi:MAG TPA: hypothetical protein VIV15_04210 [Anaerolineales bacterium]